MEFERVFGGSIYGLTSNAHYEDITKNYIDLPEFFPKELVVSGSDGGGNRICFDYRTGYTTDDPPIIY